MTVEERAKVEALCKRLFPDEVPTKKQTAPRGSLTAWNGRLWTTYQALIDTGLI